MGSAKSLHQPTDDEREDERAEENDFVAREFHRKGVARRAEGSDFGDCPATPRSRSAALVNARRDAVLEGTFIARRW